MERDTDRTTFKGKTGHSVFLKQWQRRGVQALHILRPEAAGAGAFHRTSVTDPLLFEIQFALDGPQHIIGDSPLVAQLYHGHPFGGDDRAVEPLLG